METLDQASVHFNAFMHDCDKPSHVFNIYFLFFLVKREFKKKKAQTIRWGKSTADATPTWSHS